MAEGQGGDHVSIPFIAGQWSLLNQTLGCDGARSCEVSIPFIAGQWSLRGGGGGRRAAAHVSIPFIAGQWSLLKALPALPPERGQVSIPFIAGQWSLLAWEVRVSPMTKSLNPLHCGAVVASTASIFSSFAPPVSIPFIAGQWSLP